jgi:hypothetical protein
MKKLFSLLIVSIMMFSMVACGVNETVKMEESKPEEIEQVEYQDTQEDIDQIHGDISDQDKVDGDDAITKWDEELTKKVSDYMLETWGDPEWGAPWYKNIIEIKMFNDNTVRAVLTCDINDKSTLETIAQAVFQYEYWIDTILIHDENGETLLSTTNPFNMSAYEKIN